MLEQIKLFMVTYSKGLRMISWSAMIFVAGFAVAVIGVSDLITKTDTAPSFEPMQKVVESQRILISVQDESYLMTVAHEIDAFYYKRGIRTDAEVIWEVIDEISIQLPKVFPDGPFVLSDIITIASHESNFKKNAVAKHGERGIFQILDWKGGLKAIGKPNGDAFDPRTSVRMGLHVLRQKYDRFKNYRKSIIAYNGVVLEENRQWDETYWNLFVTRKKIIRGLMNKAEKKYVARIKRDVYALKRGR